MKPINFQNLYYPETRWGGFTRVDGTIAFYIRVHSLLTTSSIVADVGCGRGSNQDDPVRVRRDLRILKGKCAKVIGIDVDAKAANNPFIDEFRPIKESAWPLEENSVHLCLADSVLEHVAEPEGFFKEAQRVLKPGGYLCLRTPNIFSYFGLAARLVPNRWRKETIAQVQVHRQAEDIFPAFYRCNTKRRLEQMMGRWGFESWVCGHEAEPSYLMFSRIFYFFGVLHQRFAPNRIKVTLFAFGRKK
jgi:SAM-dependent methyltransferase